MTGNAATMQAHGRMPVGSAHIQTPLYCTRAPFPCLPDKGPTLAPAPIG